MKQYEITNQPPAIREALSNVMATMNDRKVYDGSNFVTRVMSAQTYYPGGSLQPGRNSNSANYRYSMKGQEMDNEITGITGTHTNAAFWEYDTRLMRRLNVDPLASNYTWQSPFAAFNNNPIYFSDPTGLEGEPVERTAYMTPARKGISLPNEAENITYNDNGELTGFKIGEKSYTAKYSERDGEKYFEGYVTPATTWWGTSYDETYEDAYSSSTQFQKEFASREMAFALGSNISIRLLIEETVGAAAALYGTAAECGPIVLTAAIVITILSGDTRVKDNTGEGKVPPPLRIALGNGKGLNAFAGYVGGLPYKDWGSFLPTSTNPQMFATALIAISKCYPTSTSHFNLTALDGGRIDQTYLK